MNKDHNCTITVDVALQSLGIDTKNLGKYIYEDPGKLESILGKYYSKSGDERLDPLIVAGKIKCTFSDENNKNQTKEIKFFVPIELEGGYGALSPVTDHFNAKFETTKENYTVEVPVSNTLKPTESDRINIMIAADQTSIHDFSAKLYYNDTSYYETGPIQLHYFLPYSADELYKEGLKNLKKKTLHK